jgi:hypothetical protein
MIEDMLDVYSEIGDRASPSGDAAMSHTSGGSVDDGQWILDIGLSTKTGIQSYLPWMIGRSVCDSRVD